MINRFPIPLLCCLVSFGIGFSTGAILARNAAARTAADERRINPTVSVTTRASKDDVVIGAPAKAMVDAGSQIVSEHIELLKLLAQIDAAFMTAVPNADHLSFKIYWAQSGKAAFAGGIMPNPDGGPPGEFGLFFTRQEGQWRVANDEFNPGL